MSSCPSFVNSGGSIQTHPRIYLMFWGPTWNTAPFNGYVNKVIKFFQLLPGSDWQQGLHDFSGKNGKFTGLTYGGAVLDSSVPPVISHPPDDQLDPEILAAAANQHWIMNSQTQVIVYTEPGKSNVTYCGIHGAVKNGGGALFAWIPYTTDPPHNTPGDHCTAVYPFGSTSKIPIEGDLTWAASHELAENATAGAWTINPSDGGSEIGDPCNGVVAPFDRQPAAGVYVQYLLDQVSGECADYQAIQSTPNPGSAVSAFDGGVSCSAANACMAVGRSFSTGDAAEVTLAERWDGTSWSVVPTPNPAGSQGSFFTGVSCAAANACMAVGFYFDSAGTDFNLAEAWNGTTWTIEPTPNPPKSLPTLLGVSCTAANACTAVGYYLEVGGFDKTLAEAWNGTSWSIQPTPNAPSPIRGSFLQGVSCTAATACIAVGRADTSSEQQGTPIAEVWNGTKWSMQKVPTFTSGQLVSVSCTSATACTAVGSYSNQSTRVSGTLSASWNGKIWFYNPTVLTNADLFGVSCTGRFTCTAVGQMTDSSGTTVTLVEDPFNDGTIQPTPNPNGSTGSSLSGVSCTAAHTCTAAGSYQTSSATLTLAEAE